MTIRIPEQIKAKIRKQADINRRSMSAEVIVILERGLDSLKN